MKERVSQDILKARNSAFSTLKRVKNGLKDKEGIRYGIWLLCSFISAGAQMAFLSPFGVALCAAFAFTNLNLIVAFGAALGYVFFLSSDGLAYMGAVLVTVSLGVMTTGESRNKKFLPIVGAVAVGFTSGLLKISEGSQNIAPALAEMLITALFTYCLTYLTDDTPKEKRSIGRIALYVIFIMFFSGMHLFGMISVARCMVIFAIFIYMYIGNCQNSVITAVCFGMITDIGRGDIFYSGIYGITAAILSVMKVSGVYQIAVVYTVISGIAALICGDSGLGLSTLLESMTATAVFVTLPQSVLEHIGGLFYTAKMQDKPQRVVKSDNIKYRLSAFSGAINHVYETLESIGNISKKGNSADISYVFDRAADTACRKCPISGNCWDKDYMSTYGVMNDITETLRKKGYVTPSDFPYHFSARCLNISKLVGAINEEYSLYMRRVMREREEKSRQRLMAKQYAGIQRAIVSLGESAGETEYFPEYERRIQHILKCYDKSARASVYAVSGRLCIELFGMGEREESDIYQMCESFSLSLGRDFYKAERVKMGKNILYRIREKEKFSVSVSVGVREKKGEEVCGDSNMYFVTDDGRAVLMLSDGMGSGEEAHLASKNALSLITRFIKAGCSIEESVMAVLPVLSMNVEKIGFVTLDLLEINMFTGESKLLKYGASPTYVKRGGKVQKYISGAFPPGLEENTESVNKPVYFRLNEGNVVIMGTDGVLEEANLTELENLIKSEDDPKALTNMLIETAAKNKDRVSDDMTVLVAQMKKIR